MGRFDEIFYIGLPNSGERRKIFEIHIKKRRFKDLSKINIDTLVNLTDGFSGADIEGVVKDGIEAAFASGQKEIITENIKRAIGETSSLMELMGDSLNKLMQEYKKRKYKNATL